MAEEKYEILDDNFSTEDLFGSHTKVAKAIHSTIEAEKGGKSIALLGPWGSGKSNTIKFIKDSLKDEQHLFLFDAWKHRGDLVKRAFLEELIEFAVHFPWFASRKKHWLKKKAYLEGTVKEIDSNETSRLTYPTIFFSISVFISAGVLSFLKLSPSISKNLSKEHFDYLLLLFCTFPLSILFLVPVFHWASKYIPLNTDDLEYDKNKNPDFSKFNWFKRLFFKLKYWNTEQISVSEMILKSKKYIYKKERNLTPSPTAIEFKKIFNELMKELLETKDRKLVIVIDNLDRIEAEEARNLWSTMRTFFDFSGGTNDNKWIDRCWLIVPFDQSSINRLWGNNYQDNDTSKELSETANAFLDKTFNLTFELSPPLSMRWESYFTKLLNQAISGISVEELHDVYTLYKIKGRNHAPPTPREMKIFINQLVTLKKQWETKLYLPMIALYVILKHRNLDFKKFRRNKTADIISPMHLDFFKKYTPKDCSIKIVLGAMYFNVELKEAIHFVYGPDIVNDLVKGENRFLLEILDAPGFDNMIIEALDQIKREIIPQNPNAIPMTAKTIGSMHLKETLSITKFWKSICSEAKEPGNWENFNENIGEGIVALLIKQNESDYSNLHIKKIVNSFPINEIRAKDDDELFDPEDRVLDWLNGTIYVLNYLHIYSPAKHNDSFFIPVTEPKDYLKILMLTLVLLVDKNQFSYFRPKVSFIRKNKQRIKTFRIKQGLLEEIIKIISEGNIDKKLAETILRIKDLEINFDYEKLIPILETKLHHNIKNETNEISLILNILFGLSLDYKGAEISLINLSEPVHLQKLFATSVNEKGNVSISYLVMVFLKRLSKNGKLNEVPNSNVVFVSPDNFPNLINTFYSLFIDLKNSHLIFDCPSTSEIFNTALIQSTLKLFTENPNVTSLCKSEFFIKHFNNFDKLLYDNEKLSESLKVLIELYLKKGNLRRILISNKFKLQRCRLYNFVDKLLINKKAFRKFLVKGLRAIVSADKDFWFNELKNESLIIDLIDDLAANGVIIDLELAYQEGLQLHYHELKNEKIEIKIFEKRWGNVVNGLEKTAKTALLTYIIKDLCDSDNSASNIFSSYGELLSEESIVKRTIDNLFQYGFVKILNRLNLVELSWIESLLNKNLKLIKKVDDVAFNLFKRNLNKSLKLTDSSADITNILKHIKIIINKNRK